MGAYVGIKIIGLYTRGGTIQFLEEYRSIEPSLARNGEKAFAAELAKLPIEEQRRILDSGVEDSSQAIDTGNTEISYIQELKELAALREQGIISEEEFEREKTEILNRDRDSSE